MASRLHEVPVAWMRTEYGYWIGHGLLPLSVHHLIGDVLSSYDNFVGAFAGSKKTADLSWSPRINDGELTEFPTIALESGWSESQAQLERDSQLWLQGSAGAVKVVLLFKFFRANIHNEIKATLTVSRFADNALVMDSYAIFPPPAEPDHDPCITVEELFGGRYPIGQNPQTLFPLSLPRLRHLAEKEIRKQGYIPMAN
ncbi:unnamed protein product [Tuber aestivum]|uniref:Uncharacterized protein n=1 Tax=Tuber aestivum TaxID=59557 RepID=A0A292PNK0_9PEZI|nr:unnamed protein product [Tuber aestivum]